MTSLPIHIRGGLWRRREEGGREGEREGESLTNRGRTMAFTGLDARPTSGQIRPTMHAFSCNVRRNRDNFNSNNG